MTWMPAIPLNELQDNTRRKVTINSQDVLFIWHQNEVHAIEPKCPHLKLPLVKGTLTDDCAIICPFHKSAFSLKTGDVACWSPWPPLVGPLLGKLSKEKTLTIYPTKVDDNVVWVDL